METSSPAIEEVPETNLPLRIVVSEAGQTAALKALVAQGVPVLENPDAVTMERRLELAHRLARAIQPRGLSRDIEADACDDPAAEEDPFSWSEVDQ